MLGGAWDGTRLSKPYREAVGEEEILAEMSVLIKRYASERLDGERFGDFVIRVGIVKPTLEGKHFCKQYSTGTARHVAQLMKNDSFRLQMMTPALHKWVQVVCPSGPNTAFLYIHYSHIVHFVRLARDI